MVNGSSELYDPPEQDIPKQPSAYSQMIEFRDGFAIGLTVNVDNAFWDVVLYKKQDGQDEQEQEESGETVYKAIIRLGNGGFQAIKEEHMGAPWDLRTLPEIQRLHGLWINHNFPNQPLYRPFFGMIEELGELAHSHLKLEQGIRGNEEHVAKSKDAIGDFAMFMMHYCTLRGWNYLELINQVWEVIKERDWIAYPETGFPPAEGSIDPQKEDDDEEDYENSGGYSL